MTAIVYDSVYGNTRQVAEAIATALPGGRALDVRSARDLALAPGEALILGSPTRGFSPTPSMAEYVSGLDAVELAGRKVAVFDTRLSPQAIPIAPLRWVVEAGGYAADRMVGIIARLGKADVPHAGFFVTDTEGPLADGEIARAVDWARGAVL